MIWIFLSERQIKWEISLNLCGLLRKSELYTECQLFESSGICYIFHAYNARAHLTTIRIIFQCQNGPTPSKWVEKFQWSVIMNRDTLQNCLGFHTYIFRGKKSQPIRQMSWLFSKIQIHAQNIEFMVISFLFCRYVNWLLT